MPVSERGFGPISECLLTRTCYTAERLVRKQAVSDLLQQRTPNLMLLLVYPHRGQQIAGVRDEDGYAFHVQLNRATDEIEVPTDRQGTTSTRPNGV